MRSRATLALVGARSQRHKVSKSVMVVGPAYCAKNLRSRTGSVSRIRALGYQTERTKIGEKLFRPLEASIVDGGEEERDPYPIRGFPEREAEQIRHKIEAFQWIHISHQARSQRP